MKTICVYGIKSGDTEVTSVAEMRISKEVCSKDLSDWIVKGFHGFGVEVSSITGCCGCVVELM